MNPELSGHGEGWAPACSTCSEPLDRDGSCWYCGTEACGACGAVVPADTLTVVDGLRCCAACRAEDAAAVPEAVEVEYSGIETVRLPKEPTKELAAEWCDEQEKRDLWVEALERKAS